ncbi:MAG: hypothetical protein ABF651_01995 [Sporolactobacillus sp.]
MKKIFITLFSILTISFLFVTVVTHAASLHFIKHTYNNDANVQYYSITGEKYGTVNQQMKKQAAKNYKNDLQNKKLQKQLKDQYPYYDKLKPSINYNSQKRVSIFAEEYWYAGGEADTVYHGYNLVNGKQISLKKAFKSNIAMNKANKQVATTLRKKLKNGINIDKNGIDKYTHKKVVDEVDAFYWTKKGLYVGFNTGHIADVASGAPIVHVSNKYAKYY